VELPVVLALVTQHRFADEESASSERCHHAVVSSSPDVIQFDGGEIMLLCNYAHKPTFQKSSPGACSWYKEESGSIDTASFKVDHIFAHSVPFAFLDKHQ
jgi:hypothetical protein